MKFENLLSDLRNTTKPSEKQDVLISYDCPELRELLRLTYDNFVLFNVSIKPKDMPLPSELDLGELFYQAQSVLTFCEHSNSAKQNRELVVALLEKLNAGSQELLVGVINKNWKSGISSKAVLKLLPGIIKQFNVQLSNTYDPTKLGHKLPQWYVSYKLDGLRCVALRNGDGKWILYSRKGKELLTVDHIKPQLELIYNSKGWTFFDGELYKHGLTFEEVQGPVMAFTKGQVPEMEYHLFVGGNAENFLAGEKPNHVEVINEITELEATHIKVVNRGIINFYEIIDKVEEAFEQGYEGIMLRDPNNLYDYKRSNALLKLKRSLIGELSNQVEVISDCVVTKIEYNDNFTVVKDGKLCTEKLLNKIWVMQENGVECKVGSGYSLDFRREYTDNPWELMGSTVEIKHQEWGANGRMRFPRLFRLRKDL